MAIPSASKLEILAHVHTTIQLAEPSRSMEKKLICMGSLSSHNGLILIGIINTSFAPTIIHKHTKLALAETLDKS